MQVCTRNEREKIRPTLLAKLNSRTVRRERPAGDATFISLSSRLLPSSNAYVRVLPMAGDALHWRVDYVAQQPAPCGSSTLHLDEGDLLRLVEARAVNLLELLHELLLEREVLHEGAVLLERLRDRDLEVHAAAANLARDLRTRQRLELWHVLGEKRLARLERLAVARATRRAGRVLACEYSE